MGRRVDGTSLFLGGLLGVLGTGVVSAVNRHKGTVASPSRLRRKAIAGSLIRIGDQPAMFEPRIGSYIPIRDRRDFGGTDAAPAREVSLFLERRQKRLASSVAKLSVPPPGGLGAGVSFGQSLQHFREETGVYFYNVAPPSIGPQPNAQLIYMTSSNSASKGCEALLSFFADQQFDCAFRIWDWAHPDVPGGGKFVKNYSYAEISEYLLPYRFPLESGEELDTVCVYIANLTRQLPSGSYQNEVYLHNHFTGTRDLMWSFQFEWPTKSTDQAFWWGPIFETFPDPGAQYALGSPLGFDETVVVQDGIQYQLTDQDSTMTVPNGNGLSEVYRSQGTNSGLVCSVSDGVLDVSAPTRRAHLERPVAFTMHK